MRKPQIIFIIFPCCLLCFLGFHKATPVSSQVKNDILHLSLYGVVLSEGNSACLAVIKDERVGKILILQVGEKVKGFQLTQILKDSIMLRKEDQIYQLFLTRNRMIDTKQENHGESPKQKPVKPIENSIQERDSSFKSIRKEYIRAEVEKRIAVEWPLIAKETKFIPNRVNNKISGFKITRLPGGSILSEIGIHKNDIIKAVNGVELNDTDKLLSLFDRFQNDSQIKISLERKGRIYNILCVLQD
ncbi:MAG: hypothetical protein GTO17_09200 [Candidatus Aminicenantes bacterium]|nr:hypothetical protein [Candidatus Aminicenantes bacterium]